MIQFVKEKKQHPFDTFEYTFDNRKKKFVVKTRNGSFRFGTSALQKPTFSEAINLFSTSLQRAYTNHLRLQAPISQISKGKRKIFLNIQEISDDNDEDDDSNDEDYSPPGGMEFEDSD